MTSTRTVGILHPGSMGAAVAAQAKQNGAEVFWCPAGRSAATQRRAEEAGLSAVGSIVEMAGRCEIIISLCPPAHAEALGIEVGAIGFSGIYVDANAISPASVASISARGFGSSENVVDGAVIGSPPSRTKSPRLYLSGHDEPVRKVAEVFQDTAVDVRLVKGGLGKASALKLAYSSYQKTSRVLAAVAYALASDYQVEDELLDIASLRTTNYLSETAYIPKTVARSWRWAPEMEEAVSVLTEAALPADLAEAAARVMRRWADDKDRPMELAEALEHLHVTSEPPH